MKLFKKYNIFTFLPVVFVFAIMLRVFDIASFSTPSSIAESTPSAEKFEPVNEEPPPMPAVKAETHEPAGPEKKAEGAATPTVPAEAVPPPAGASYGERSFSASELEVLQSLSKRRDELDKREQTVGQKEALLKAAGGEVDRKIAELNKIRGELESLLGKQQTVQDERITSLVKIYEGMKPKEAARIFDTLEMDILLSVISKMSERKSSPILASMDPEKARQVTIQLAEQRRLPTLPDAKKDKASGANPPPLPR